MNKVWAATACSAVALVGLAGAANAECVWAGNHWNCGDRYIYPKSYPWGTAVIDGQYQRPMLPPQSDVDYPASIPAGSR
jgi:hypothetical protein